MGKLGIYFSEKVARHPKGEKPHYATVDQKKPKPGDGPIDRAIAWCSYFTMVIVSLCVLNVPAMAEVATFIAGSEIVIDWQLRPTVD